MKTEALIQCQQLVAGHLPFDYQGNALDLTIKPGEVISMIGPKNAGKSQWLKTLSGLIEQEDGELLFNGINTSTMNASQWTQTRLRVAYVHADTALLSATNGLMNVLIPALYHRLDKNAGKQLLAEQALEILEQIDPDINLDDLPAYISKEHQFKIAVARALILNPDILILDQPFTHFEIDTKPQFKTFLKNRVKQGLSLITLTHDIDFARHNSDKIIFVDKTGLQQFSPAQSLFESRNTVVQDFVKFQALTM